MGSEEKLHCRDSFIWMLWVRKAWPDYGTLFEGRTSNLRLIVAQPPRADTSKDLFCAFGLAPETATWWQQASRNRHQGVWGRNWLNIAIFNIPDVHI